MKYPRATLVIFACIALASAPGWSAEIPGQVSLALPALGQGAPSQPFKLPTVSPNNIPEVGVVDRLHQNQIAISECAVGTAHTAPSECKYPTATSEISVGKLVGNARPASDVQYGFVVAIYYAGIDRATYLCSGTLLTSRLILTAGHCGCGLPGTYWVDVHQNAHQPPPSDLHYVDGPPILYDQTVCRNNNLSQGNDLALLRLRDAVDLAGPDYPPDSSLWAGYGYPPEFIWDLRAKLVRGASLIAIGYGYTSQLLLGVRMQADIPIFSFDCEEAALAAVCAPFAEMILAEAPGPRLRSDTCGGDSGGPVFRMEGNRPRLVAVTSRAAPGLQDNPVLHCGGGGIYSLIGRKSVQHWLAANGVPPESNTATASQ